MQYGVEKTIEDLDDGSTISSIDKYRKGKSANTVKHFRIRIKIYTSQQEMTEFINFTEELAKYRLDKILVTDREDPSTKPAFIIEYPKEDVDGSYFIVKNYCIML